MGHIEASRMLSATPDALWAIVSDLPNWDKWFTVHEKWTSDVPETIVVGTPLTAKIVMLGMANKISWTVEKIDAPTSFALSGTGMAGVKALFEFTLTPAGKGAEFTVAGDFEGALVKGALAKAVEKDAKKQLDKSLDQLDALASAAV
ncbi:SRPBCC family protein [Mycobacterium sp. 23]|uniref:type II toxin-antitoxin system Rv0910 family toxin n=1 Tax=Mycobacterium sp. 23 TaxID=3400424 RepID=UPI003AAF5DD1